MPKRSRVSAPARVGTDKTFPHDIVREIKTSFLDYSMSVIAQRALPDVRDGLKPVHRRVLYAMHEMGLLPTRPYKKSATVVGEVLGKYHPHGDASVYDTMVRLAQEFAMAEPLVDGQGNWGSIDGDSAAAYRYTEARLTPIALELLADIDKETVDFRPNFDDRLQEPTVLPARLPHLLLNGSEGIAVGMATKIPPHNLRELGAAIILLCEQPNASDDAVLAKIKGPDFPTGGVLVQSPAIKTFYRTGRGKMTLRGKAHVETMRTGKPAIVITEIPYGVMKAKLLAEIAELVKTSLKPKGKGALPWHEWISDLRDESSREGIRAIVELKRGVDPATVLAALFAKTSLSITYGGLLLALVPDAGSGALMPRVLTLREALTIFIAHRLDVVVRRARFERAQAEARAHILDGLLIAIANIERVVELIKTSKDSEAARPRLMKAFRLTERQAKAILELRLARLTTLDVRTLKDELTEMRARIKRLTALLASPKAQREVVRDETRELVERFGRPRRTTFVSAKAAETVTAETVDHAATLSLSLGGQVRRLDEGKRARARTADPEQFRVTVRAAEQAILLTDRGRAFGLAAHDLPSTVAEKGGSLASIVTGFGRRERVLLALGPADVARGGSVVFVLANGMVKRTALDEYAQPRAGGVQATVLHDEDALVAVLHVSDAADLVLASAQGKAIRFPVADVPVQGRVSRGVRGMKLADDDHVVGAAVLGTSLVVVTVAGQAKRVPAAEFPRQGRAGQGVILLKPTPASGPVATIASLESGADLAVVSDSGVAVRLPAREVPEAGRTARSIPVAPLAGWTVVGGAVIPALGR